MCWCPLHFRATVPNPPYRWSTWGSCNAKQLPRSLELATDATFPAAAVAPDDSSTLQLNRLLCPAHVHVKRQTCEQHGGPFADLHLRRFFLSWERESCLPSVLLIRKVRIMAKVHTIQRDHYGKEQKALAAYLWWGCCRWSHSHETPLPPKTAPPAGIRPTESLPI